MMEQYNGKRVKIRIKGEHKVFFTADIISTTVSHINFIDKYGFNYSFLHTEIAEISDKVKE